MMKIDLNSAGAGELSQLPGISKNIAYRIVNHRKRHGWFTSWDELVEAKEFPSDRLDEIKLRAKLSCPDEPGACAPPRRVKAPGRSEQETCSVHTCSQEHASIRPNEGIGRPAALTRLLDDAK
jgi:hypothetical protein